MAKIDSKKRDAELSEKLEKSGILVRTTLNVVGTPKEHVEEALKTTLQGVKDHESIRILEQKVFEAEKIDDDKMWSAFAEIEMLCKDMDELTGFCFDFMPASVEVVEPEHIRFRNNEITSMLNEINTKMHTVEMGARRFNIERQVALAKMNSLIRYSILRALERSEQTKDQLMNEVGIDDKGMDEFLESLEKRKEIEKKGKKYKSTGKVKTKK